MTELLWDALLKGPLKASGNSFAGRTAVNSNVASVVISASAVNSDSLIFLTMDSGNTSQTSGIAQPMEVSSIVSGTSFTVGWADGNAQADRATTVMWMIVQRS